MIEAEKLISVVKTKTSLWLPSDENYPKKDLKNNTWKEVCKELIPEIEEENLDVQATYIRKKWGNIRDTYRRFFLGTIRYGKTSSERKKYVYADQLQFLDPVLEKKRKTSSNSNNCNNSNDFDSYETPMDNGWMEKPVITLPSIKSSPLSPSPLESVSIRPSREIKFRKKSVDICSEESYEALTESPWSPSPLPLSPAPSHKLKSTSQITENLPLIQKEILESQSKILSILKSRQFENITQTDDEDADKSFLLSFLPDIKSLSEIQKMRFKRAMIDVIHTIKFPSTEITSICPSTISDSSTQ